METKIALSIFLLTIVSFQTISAFDFRSLADLDLDLYEDFKCESFGYKCKYCNTSVLCVPNTEGGFDEVETLCTNDQTCLESTGRCTDETNLLCLETGSLFECHQAGVFPNPLTCNKYYMCTKADADPVEVNCGQSWKFDPKTGRCSIKNEDGKCDPPIPECKNSTQIGAVPGNPSIFYMCVYKEIESGKEILYPDQYYCGNGMTFDGNRCVDTYPKTGLDSDGKCIDKGYFYNPTNCMLYRDCLSPGATPIDRACATYYKFDPVTQTCVLFNCNTCN